MEKQKVLRLAVARIPGETSFNFKARSRDLNLRHEIPRPVPTEKLFCDALKREARESMAGVTECPAVAMPHALARLMGVREIILASIRLELVPGAETLRSGAALYQAHTLADLLACIENTRRDHRAPAFLNSRDTELAGLRHDFSQLAGLVCLALPHVKMPDCFCVEESEVFCECIRNGN